MAHSRSATLLALVLLGLAGAAREAVAGATVDLLFVGRNGSAIAPTDTVAAATGDTLTMAVVMSNDEPLIAAVFSLNYDLSGEELDVASAFQWSGVTFGPGPYDYFVPYDPLEPTTATFVGPFSGIVGSLALPTLLPAGSYQMGTVTWSVTNAQTDGADILSGLLNIGVDSFTDAAFNQLTALEFNSATVNLVPEPGTTLLLGLGLVGLALAARRSR